MLLVLRFRSELLLVSRDSDSHSMSASTNACVRRYAPVWKEFADYRTFYFSRRLETAR
jgi:hypothetical protein